MAARKNYVLVLFGFRFEAGTILKMTVAMNGEDGATRPFYDKTIRLPQDGHKIYIQQGMLRWIIFARTIHPVEGTPLTMFSRIGEQAHKGHWHVQFTNVMSSFFSSCKIMMICSG